MKADIGFWDINNEYIEDIQEVDDMELRRETSDEKIIKMKGNTKCIFYSDNICRKGDRTRDCVNCARVEYHSLYSLNWDNQEKAEKTIEKLQQENARLKEEINRISNMRICYEENLKLCKWQEQHINKLATALEEIKRICEEEKCPCKYEEKGCHYECSTSAIAMFAEDIKEVIDGVLQ